MSIVEFPKRLRDEDYIWVCGCGCSTFKIRGDGELECASCYKNPEPDDNSGWFNRIVDDGDREEEPIQIRIGNDDTGDFSERLIKTDAAKPDATWIMFGRDDGSVSAWFKHEFDGEEHFQWLDERITVGRNLLMKGRTDAERSD